MKTWRTIAAAIAAFSLAAAIGCNADSGKNEDNRQPEPAVQDGGQKDAGGEDAPANGPQPEDGGGTGGQDAEPDEGASGVSGGDDGVSGDQPVDLPMPTDPSEPQADDPAAGEGGSDEGTVSIMPVTEPAMEMEILPAVPEPTGDGPIPSGEGGSGQAGGTDPNTPVSNRARTP